MILFLLNEKFDFANIDNIASSISPDNILQGPKLETRKNIRIFKEKLIFEK